MKKLSESGRKELNKSIIQLIDPSNVTAIYVSAVFADVVATFEENKYVYEFSRLHTISGNPETISLDESMFIEVE